MLKPTNRLFPPYIYSMKFLLFLSYLAIFAGCIKESDDIDPFDIKRQKMVEEQIRKRGIQDERVLKAMLKVKRHLFVQEKSRDSAYEDYPLNIGYQQTISQPAIVGYMTEILQLKESDKVLEIGTGSGYQAAILAEMAGEVFTIEILEPLAREADKRLKLLGYTNISVRHGDGYKGWPEKSPFDAIIVTAAPKEVPQELIKQLRVGGRMIIPVGSITQHLYLIEKTEQGIEQKNVLPVSFVPMVSGQETPSP